MQFTQNPIGSDSQLDLSDNAIAFDYAMNSPAALWTDRFGKQHKTVQQALKDVGFKPAGFDFVSGGTLGIGDRDKCVFYPTDGYWYSWNGKLPYVVPANSSPTPGGKKGWNLSTVNNNVSIVFETVSDMVRYDNHIIGQMVEWKGYHVVGDCGGGFGVVKGGGHINNGGSIFSLDDTKYIEAFLSTTVPSIKFGVKFDGLSSSASQNTVQLQAFLDFVTENNREGVFGVGVAKHLGLRITKSSRLRGIKTSGPEFGHRGNYIGSTLANINPNGHAIIVDATNSPDNTGIHCTWDDFTVYGNRLIEGVRAGHNIYLKADTNGEKTFIEGSQFRNIQSIYAKEQGWCLEGTIFSNDWWGCSGSYNGTHGVSRGELGGNPVTNNFHACKFFDNLQHGVYNNGITMSFFGCNIAQNYAGGLVSQSGYVESINCDYEQNAVFSIETRDSSGSGILVTGGKIHKSPGTNQVVGIRASNGSSGGVIRDVLFINFDTAGDKIFESTGGTIQEFSYRLQNVTTGQLTPTDMAAIERIPNLDFPRRDIVEFPGSGPGKRQVVLNFKNPFKVGYVISATVREAGGVNPAPSGISTNNITLSSVTLTIEVEANVGPVYFDWIANGR